MTEIIHISYGGPEFYLNAGKQYRFEDHPYCGPVVLGKNGDVLTIQPSERSTFWQHINAWYQQGKQFKTICGKNWCVYETQMQAARRMGAKA